MENAKDELEFCLELWGKKDGCDFGGGTRCEECAAPYVLYKLITGEVLHDDERLTQEDWRGKLKEVKG